MRIGVLSLRLRLEGCSSLKEKRQRLNGLRDRFGRLPAVAVCESDLADSRQQAEWSFVCAGNDAANVTRKLDGIEKFVLENVDADIVDRQFELF